MLDNSTGTELDTSALNAVLPGLLQHYGNVAKQVSLNVTFDTVSDFRTYPEDEKLYILAQATARLYVQNAYLNGTDDLAIEWKLHNVHTNLTLHKNITLLSPDDPFNTTSVWPQVADCVAEQFVTTHSVIPVVNDLLFTEAFRTLMRPNAALLPLSNLSIQETILLPIPPFPFGLVTFENITIHWYDGYVMIGMDPWFPNPFKNGTTFEDLGINLRPPCCDPEPTEYELTLEETSDEWAPEPILQ